MARSVTDIITLQQARVALQVEGEDEAHDAHIAAYVTGAVQSVDQMTQIGLLTRRLTETYRLGVTPVRLVRKHGQIISNVTYRAEGWERAVDQVVNYRSGETDIGPPPEGWPRGEFRLTYDIDIPVGSIPGVLRGACLLLLRDVYDGEREVSSAITQLCEPYRDRRVRWGDSDLVSVPVMTQDFGFYVGETNALWVTWGDAEVASTGLSVILPEGSGELSIEISPDVWGAAQDAAIFIDDQPVRGMFTDPQLSARGRELRAPISAGQAGRRLTVALIGS